MPFPSVFVCVLLCLSALLPARVAAQEADADTTVIPLAPVVVTALRTPIVLSRVPYAVAVNGPAEIRRGRPGLALDEALFGIPGVQVDNRYNEALGERISIRGFGSRAQFGVRGVKVYLDGIPATLPDGQTALSHTDLGTLGSVEVIRGPASSLYGNAAGGVILLETEPAPPVPLGQTFGVTAGQHGLLRLQSTTGGRSGDTAYLVHLTRLAYDGYRAFSTAENYHAQARLSRGDARGGWRVLGHFVHYDAQNPGSLSDSLLAADRLQAYGYNRVQQTGEAGWQGQAGARWHRTLAIGTVEVAGYGLRRAIDNPIPPTIIGLTRSAGGLRALLRSDARYPGEMEGLRWTVGAEADLQHDDRRNWTNEAGTRGTLTLDQLERVWNASAFAQLAAPLTARLHLMGGLRYDLFRFSADDRLVGAGHPDDSGSRRMDAVSPSVGLSYAVRPALSLYGNVSTAFETPTTTELANRPSGAGGFNARLEPQRIRSFEVGARGRLGAVAAYQVAVYRAGVENALIPFEVPDAPGRQFFRNAGSAVHRGVEAGATWVPLDGLRLNLAYTYTDARFDAYVVDAAVYDGNQIPGVAPHRLEAGLSYAAWQGWFAALEARYASEMAVNDVNTAFSDAYLLTDVRLGHDAVRVGSVGLTAFAGVNNVLDVHYNASVVVNAFGGRYYEPGPGRALYAGLTLQLGWDGDV